MKNHSKLTHVFRIFNVFVIVTGFLIVFPVRVSGFDSYPPGDYSGTIATFEKDLPNVSGSFLEKDYLEQLKEKALEGT